MPFSVSDISNIFKWLQMEHDPRKSNSVFHWKSREIEIFGE